MYLKMMSSFYTRSIIFVLASLCFDALAEEGMWQVRLKQAEESLADLKQSYPQVREILVTDEEPTDGKPVVIFTPAFSVISYHTNRDYP